VNKIERSQVLALKEMGYGEGSYAIDSMHKRELAVEGSFQKKFKSKWFPNS